MDKRIYEFFRKKPDVIQSIFPMSRAPGEKNPGIDLALELYQGNAISVATRPKRRRNMYASLTFGTSKQADQKALMNELLAPFNQSMHVDNLDIQKTKLRQIKALEEVAKINNIRLQNNQGVTQEELEKLRCDNYLMSPGGPSASLQGSRQVAPEASDTILMNELVAAAERQQDVELRSPPNIRAGKSTKVFDFQKEGSQEPEAAHGELNQPSPDFAEAPARLSPVNPFFSDALQARLASPSAGAQRNCVLVEATLPPHSSVRPSPRALPTKRLHLDEREFRLKDVPDLEQKLSE